MMMIEIRMGLLRWALLIFFNNFVAPFYLDLSKTKKIRDEWNTQDDDKFYTNTLFLLPNLQADHKLFLRTLYKRCDVWYKF